MTASLPVPAFHLEDVHTKTCWTASDWHETLSHEAMNGPSFFLFFFEAILALMLEDIIASATVTITSTCFTSRQTVVHVARGVVSVHGSKYFTCWRADKLEWLGGRGGEGWGGASAPSTPPPSSIPADTTGFERGVYMVSLSCVSARLGREHMRGGPGQAKGGAVFIQ